MSFTPVANIVGFRPTQVIVGQEVELLADVVPNNATNRTIEWSIVTGNATIRRSGTRSFLTAHVSENISVRAAIRNGTQG